jgi:hypothetical protein
LSSDRVPEARTGPAFNLVLENKEINTTSLMAVKVTFQEKYFDYVLVYS